MTALQYLRDPKSGCCTTAELMALNKADNEGYRTIMRWAKEEMINKGIPVDEPAPAKVG